MREMITNSSSFYCMNCGEKGIPVCRKKSKQKGKHHRKKLYCIHCKNEVNHIECRNDVEVEEFKKAFAAGEYKEEALESIQTSKNHDIFSKLFA